jgi:hypothetical protein
VAAAAAREFIVVVWEGAVVVAQQSAAVVMVAVVTAAAVTAAVVTAAEGKDTNVQRKPERAHRDMMQEAASIGGLLLFWRHESSGTRHSHVELRGACADSGLARLSRSHPGQC